MRSTIRTGYRGWRFWVEYMAGVGHNAALRHEDAESFAAALLENVPPPPADQAAIVAANRSPRLATRA